MIEKLKIINFTINFLLIEIFFNQLLHTDLIVRRVIDEIIININ
jgi:hypothetical protein